MEIPAGSERFTFPNVQPSSPPPTPSPSNARQSTHANHVAALFAKRYGFVGVRSSLPENIEPRGVEFQFSYTPPRRDQSSDSSTTESVSSEDSDAEESEAGDSDPDEKPQPCTSEPPSQRNVTVRAIDEEKDFTIEEVSDDDIGYDDIEVIHPDTFEDAESEQDHLESAEVNDDIMGRLHDLLCGHSITPNDFEDIQRSRYLRKKKRWSKGGSHKRSHAESVGSDSDNDSIESLDSLQVGSSARRLRRRTQGTSLLFEDPPREIEELKLLNSQATESPTLQSDDEADESSSSDEETGLVEITELEADELILPYWFLPMEIESEPSRPASATGFRGRRNKRH